MKYLRPDLCPRYLYRFEQCVVNAVKKLVRAIFQNCIRKDITFAEVERVI
jgi:hypothetical protein